MANNLPSTEDVLGEVGRGGVIVGSWPRKRASAKDLDIVVRPRKSAEPRHPIFAALFRRWPGACESSFMGHVYVRADPMNVELFESDGTLPPDDPSKHAGVLTYRQARLRATEVEAYGIWMLAVL